MTVETYKTLDLKNAGTANLGDVVQMSLEDFRKCIISRVKAGMRLSNMFAAKKADSFILYAVLADDNEGSLSLLSCESGKSYDSMTNDCPQAHMFEREIYEQMGIMPEGHPWLKPVRFLNDNSTENKNKAKTKRPEIGRTDYFEVTGEEVHEVAVGPVHAGVIEPGHFRFQCHGERVFTLEISLGYQHRGIEKAVLAGPHKRTIHHMEALSGDTTIGHTTAYCQNIEKLSNCTPPAKALAIRNIMLELERMANHIGDLGALGADVGYLPTSSYCGAIRGDMLNITAMVCGNRFGRGIVVPGGVAWDIDEKLAQEMVERVQTTGDYAKEAIDMLWETPSVMARFQGVGALSLQTCRDIGLVGPAARACGLHIDTRQDHNFGYPYATPEAAYETHTGDVYARAYVRWLEIAESLKFVKRQLQTLPNTPIYLEPGPIMANKIAVSLTEGWRGEVCHTAITDKDGNFSSYKIVDPSFHNWFGLALALREQEISDFPLCNKSFNLSYCGFDL